MNSKRLAPLIVLLLLICARATAAQPTCFVNYDIFDMCHSFNADIMFTGRVVYLTATNPDELGDNKQTEMDSIHGSVRGKAVVVVDTLFKGQAEGEVELALRNGCWGTIEKGKHYIFNVRKTARGLEADRWSGALDTLPNGDVKQFVEMIRSVLRGERQPRLFGMLRHWSPEGPHHTGQPIPDVTVVAEKDGEKFETRTGADGRYEFRELPDGQYKVYPLLPESLRPIENDPTTPPRDHHENGAVIYNQLLCGPRVDFLAWDNGVIAGRVEDADGGPVRFQFQSQIQQFDGRGRRKDADGKPMKWLQVNLLWMIDKNVRQSAPYPAIRIMEVKEGEFAFGNLPPGPYVLEFVGWDEDYQTAYFNYPGDMPGNKDGPGINLTDHPIRDLVIRLPFPSRK